MITNTFFFIRLTALHFNYNVTRLQSKAKDGEKQYCVLYSVGQHGELLVSFMFVYRHLKEKSLKYTC